MVFYELCQRVCINLDRTDLSGSDIDALSASRAGMWVNDTRLDLANKYKFSFYYAEATISTVAGSAYYPMPSDFLDYFTIFCGNVKLGKYSPQNFDEGISTSATGTIATNLASGQPYFYTLRGREFQVYPTPDLSTYELNLRYYAQPTTLGASGSYDNVTNLYAEAIVAGATHRGSLWAEDNFNEQRYGEQYIRHVQEMIANEKRREHGDAHFRLKTWRDFVIGKFADQMRINYDGKTGHRRGRSNYNNQS